MAHGSGSNFIDLTLDSDSENEQIIPRHSSQQHDSRQSATTRPIISRSQPSTVVKTSPQSGPPQSFTKISRFHDGRISEPITIPSRHNEGSNRQVSKNDSVPATMHGNHSQQYQSSISPHIPSNSARTAAQHIISNGSRVRSELTTSRVIQDLRTCLQAGAVPNSQLASSSAHKHVQRSLADTRSHINHKPPPKSTNVQDNHTHTQTEPFANWRLPLNPAIEDTIKVDVVNSKPVVESEPPTNKDKLDRSSNLEPEPPVEQQISLSSTDEYTTSDRITSDEPDMELRSTSNKAVKHNRTILQTGRPTRRRFSSSSANDYTSEDSLRRSKRRKTGATLQGHLSLEGKQVPSKAFNNMFGVPGTHLTYPFHTRGALLRHRSIGGPTTMSSVQSFTLIKDSYLDTMIRPWARWTGASRDIIRSAWAPDGSSLVVGASTDMDTRNQIYNRGKNLLWCDLLNHTVAELDDHKIPRPLLETQSSQEGNIPNNSLDPDLYTTISDICYGSNPHRFYTASYDKTVKIWTQSPGSNRPSLQKTIEHPNQVNILARCNTSSTEVIVSAQGSRSQAVTVYQLSTSSHPSTVIESDQSEKHNLIPSALSWGHFNTNTGHLLAVGYGNDVSEANRHSRGDILLWNLETQSKSIELQKRFRGVYDMAWCSQKPRLVVATSTDNKKYVGLASVKSNIGIWSPKEGPICSVDFDCPALDINRVLLHPFDIHYVSAACTDGAIYLYDVRNPSCVVGRFEHGESIAQLDRQRNREIDDYGIQFASWNPAGTLIYSGSSDGKLKQWNPYLNETDAFISDVATFDAGISTGSFSPDFTNLVIGTTKGSMHVLSSAPVTAWKDEEDTGIEKSENAEDVSFRFMPALSSGTVGGLDREDSQT